MVNPVCFRLQCPLGHALQPCPDNDRFLDIAFLMPEPVRLGSLCVRKPGQEISCPANGVAQSANASCHSWRLAGNFSCLECLFEYDPTPLAKCSGREGG